MIFLLYTLVVYLVKYCFAKSIFINSEWMKALVSTLPPPPQPPMQPPPQQQQQGGGQQPNKVAQDPNVPPPPAYTPSNIFLYIISFISAFICIFMN